MTKKTWVIIFFCLLAALTGCGSRKSEKKTEKNNESNTNYLQQTHLNKKSILNLFKCVLNEDKRSYELKYIKWQEGAFTDKDAHDAVVSFFDGNQCHADGYSEIWLLRFVDGWKIDRKLADSDGGSFKPVDINKDGKMEIWITGEGGNQGCFTLIGELISLDAWGTHILYSNKGLDCVGAQIEGKETLCSHQVEFKDVDNDGILEIIDLEVRKAFHWIGRGPGAKHVEIWSKSRKFVYKLHGGSFRKTQHDNIER